MALHRRCGGAHRSRGACHAPRPGWSEQDPELWWRGAEQVLERLRSRAGKAEAIGLSGQMHGLVPLDRDDRVLRPAMLWNDQRTASEVSEIEARLGGIEGLVAATGNRMMTGFTAPKLLWMAHHEPELHRRVASVLLPKDYVRLRLCGERATDVTDASGTGWFDVGARTWSGAVLEALELDRAWLPVAHESFQASGRSAGGVVVAAGAGAGDQAAGALGVGALTAGSASVVLGTSGVLCTPLERYAADPLGRVQASCHVLSDGWFLMGVMLSAAGSLRWLHDIVGSGVPIGALLEEAAGWPPGVEGLTFLPYLSGERTPHADARVRGAFVGLDVRHDRGAIVRAVLEGVALGLRDVLVLLGELGVRPGLARVSGGGARSDLWLSILASVLELPLQRVAVEEGAAYGAALLGGVAAGRWRDPHEAVDACVRARGTGR
ncbi:MAG: xylulokinase [Solirubrobacteraceae bacterium]